MSWLRPGSKWVLEIQLLSLPLLYVVFCSCLTSLLGSAGAQPSNLRHLHLVSEPELNSAPAALKGCKTKACQQIQDISLCCILSYNISDVRNLRLRKRCVDVS